MVAVLALSVVSANAQRLKQSEVKGIYLRQATSFGAGGMMITTFQPYLLLNDGTFWKKMDVPPMELDVQQSRRNDPKSWGQWKMEGSKIAVMDRTKWTTPVMYLARPATAGTKLEGTYRAVSGGGNTSLGGDVMVMATTNITFSTDGSFESKSGSGATTSRVSTSSSSTSRGTYSLDGYTIVLKYQDGRTVRKPFVYMNKTGDRGIFIGGTGYTKRR